MNKVMSERQQYWHEHLQRADEQGMSLAAYARDAGLNLKQLYGAKMWLVKLGHWPRAVQASSTLSTLSTDAAVSEFVAVQLSPPSQTGTSLRVRHGSGWVLECDGASASWLAQLLAALSSTPHAAA